jgi:hypothetical protein
MFTQIHLNGEKPFLIIIDHIGDFKDICINWLMMELISFELVFGIDIHCDIIAKFLSIETVR